MERKNQIEGLDLPLKKQTSSEERQMSISQSVRDNNCKIIKLIREKIYPLHASEVEVVPNIEIDANISKTKGEV